MNDLNITFIGAGNMAKSLIGGLIAKGFNPSQITAADPFEASRTSIATLGIHVTSDNLSAIAAANVVVLAVKPQMMEEVLAPLKDQLATNQPLIISIAAGIDLRSLEAWTNSSMPIVRCMPNTPALLQQGATGLYANAHTTTSQKASAEQLLEAAGMTCWVATEELLDAVTAVSGSGPAYFFLFIEAMIDEGVKLGLDHQTASELAIKTCAGAAAMAANSSEPVAALRQQVCSPGGTTERAVAAFEKGDLRGLVAKAMQDCAARADSLAQELGAK